MRPILLVLMGIVLLFSGPLPAGEITLTATDNRDGTLTIGISSYSGYPPVGIALKLDPNSTLLAGLERGQPYYDVITTIEPNSGSVTSFAALAALSDKDAFPAQVTNLITLDFASPASGKIMEDVLRGGIVNNQGESMAGNLPLAFSVTYCGCYGDIADSAGNPNPDGIVDLGDFNHFIFALSSNNLTINPVPEDLTCGDMANSNQVFGPNGVIDLGDFNYFLNYLSSNGIPTECISP